MYLGRPTSTGGQLKKSPCIITIISQVVVATKEAEVYQLTLLTFKHRLILSCPARWLLFSSMINGHASDLTIKISSCLWSDDYDQHLIVSTSDQFSAVPFPVCQLASMLSVGRRVFRWTSLTSISFWKRNWVGNMTSISSIFAVHPFSMQCTLEQITIRSGPTRVSWSFKFHHRLLPWLPPR